MIPKMKNGGWSFVVRATPPCLILSAESSPCIRRCTTASMRNRVRLDRLSCSVCEQRKRRPWAGWGCFDYHYLDQTLMESAIDYPTF